jgi:CRP-like cAMP-binding protein
MPPSAPRAVLSGAGSDFFERLLPEQRARLESAATRHTYGAGETVFHEGTPALAVYAVGSGVIELFRRLDQGEEVVVGTRGAGDLVGLRGVLAGLPYATTGRTLERATLFCIPADCFVGLVRENATLAYRLLARLARESRLAETQLVERNHHRVAKRIARFLVERAQGPTPLNVAPPWREIAMSREDMARLIGTTPETLSRTLHGFAERGVLELDRKEIRIRDLASLLRLAE